MVISLIPSYMTAVQQVSLVGQVSLYLYHHRVFRVMILSMFEAMAVVSCQIQIQLMIGNINGQSLVVWEQYASNRSLVRLNR